MSRTKIPLVGYFKVEKLALERLGNFPIVTLFLSGRGMIQMQSCVKPYSKLLTPPETSQEVPLEIKPLILFCPLSGYHKFSTPSVAITGRTVRVGEGW